MPWFAWVVHNSAIVSIIAWIKGIITLLWFALVWQEVSVLSLPQRYQTKKAIDIGFSDMYTYEHHER